MKNLIKIATVSVLLSTSLISCSGGHHLCPTYSNLDDSRETIKNEKKNIEINSAQLENVKTQQAY